MPRGCIAKASLMFTNASQKYRRYITDHLNEQSAIVTECLANIRLYRRCFGEHSPNHRKSIFFIGTAGIYAQNRKASGSIACIIIHFTIADAKIPNGTEALCTCVIDMDSLCLGPIGDFCIRDGEMYNYTRDASRCLAILSINTSSSDEKNWLAMAWRMFAKASPI